MTVRAIFDVLGVEGFEPEVDLGPFLPPVVQANAEDGVLVPGDVVTIRLRVRVRQIVPVPLMDGET